MPAAETALMKQALHLQGVDPRPDHGSKVVEEVEPYVMPGKMVLRSRVAEADEQKSGIRHE